MEINFIILTHKNPLQVKRLITRLKGDNTYFYVHIDRNVDIQPFYKTLQSFPNVFLLEKEERQNGIWGDFGIVKGTLNAINRIIADERRGYTILLSGQDYPLRNPKYLTRFLQKRAGYHFIDIYQSPGNWDKNTLDRISKYKINKSSKRGHFLLLPSIFEKEFYKSETAGKLNFLRKTGRAGEILNIFRKRRFPKYLKPYGGSVYWAFPNTTLKKIIQFLQEHPDYLEYYRHSLCADEIFFHSILKNLQKYDNRIIIQPSLTYVNWKRKKGPLPVTFVKADLEELKTAAKKKIFARKFDSELDEKILDLIDSELIISSN